ncbi:hypothetical protein V498_04671 [Pseudogymnoascus sp. VKM F-4517 (FW-2822)]|nr:hypothetical protein V498_04671 [Pseudogymnoascus sp. VKM F-4517 (FW-2822)]
MPQPTQAQFSNQEGRIILAITALKEGNIKSIRAAAMSYNVLFESLRARLNGVTSRRDSTPNSRKLTSYEESALVKYILDLDLRGFPPRPKANLRANRILEQDIYNFDKAGFAMGVIATAKVVTSLEAKNRPKTIQPGNRE